MVDLQTILAGHRSKQKNMAENVNDVSLVASYSDIPDLFFDQILIQFKLSRIETMVLIYLYRLVWCRPNIYKQYGISPLLAHTEIVKKLAIESEELYLALRRIEELGMIVTIRLGQYFVRKFFTKENDELFGIHYDDFDSN